LSRLGEVRSLVCQNPVVPVLALTAIANKQTRQKVEESLYLRKGFVMVYISPNRENIYVNRVQMTSDIIKSFQWLFEKVRDQQWKNTSFIASQSEIVGVSLNTSKLNALYLQRMP